MENQKIKKRGKFILSILVSLIFVWFAYLFLFSGEFLRFHYANAENRKKLIEIREEIKEGDSYISVLKVFWKKREKSNLDLATVSEKCWYISMPTEIGATDWRIYIDFSEDKITSVLVRNSDGGKPSNTPDDIGNGKNCGF